MSVQPLFTPLRMGDLDLPNRIVMAPLTRMRAGSMDHVPTALQAEYYAQRASAGLIVAEATAISADGFGYADTPGLWSADQVRGWRLVTDLHRQSRPGRAARDRRSGCRSRLDNRLCVGTTRLFRLSGYPPGGGRVNSTRGLMRTRPINSVRSAWKPGAFDWGATVPITSCGKVEANLPDRAAYLGHGLTAYAALTRGLDVHPGDAVFVSSGGELPRNFVDGPIIWKGI